jgi:hypothetical protein
MAKKSEERKDIRTEDINTENKALFKTSENSYMKLSEKSSEISRGNSSLEAYKEFYNLWAKIYETAFENFFESTPTVSPFKGIFEPVKNAAKIYAEIFTGLSSNWMKSYTISASAV